MTPELKKQLIKQLESVLSYFTVVRSRCQYDDLSDGKYADIHGFIARGQSAVIRISGEKSSYSKHINDVMKNSIFDGAKACMVRGIVESLTADVEAGYIQSVEELIHAELFADFLEMSTHLLKEGYKDAAAVIAGSSLESHLRQLCDKFGVETEIDSDSSSKPKKADRINSDLVTAGAYSKLDQKNVTAWVQ